ncbi:unnamed protein product [Echinostoma caproni]|uniref:XPG-I domain-containing protein n=1 Tax=Echinostoma caproni TaxID=27848 RepID=A0A3P8LBB6_9TREM|nr:unnamed protein product [Echinostoma caproni]
MAKAGKVFAVGTEDMDALAFGTPVLLRHLTFSEARLVFLVSQKRVFSIGFCLLVPYFSNINVISVVNVRFSQP